MYKKTALTAALAAASLVPLSQAQAADYVIDTDGQHAFVQFKISHLGFSYILGSFEEFDGGFSYDPEAPEASTAQLEVDVDSLTTNHAERDKHIKSEDFLDVAEYPTASFTSTGFHRRGRGRAKRRADPARRDPYHRDAGDPAGRGRRSLGQLPGRLRGLHDPHARRLWHRHVELP